MAIPGTQDAIETTRIVDFRLAVEFQLAEQPVKLAEIVGSTASYDGSVSGQVLDRFDDLVASEITTRNGATAHTDIDVERRFIHKPTRQAIATLIDPDDLLSTKVDLKSPIAQQAVRGINRVKSDAILRGFFGTAYTGRTGTTQVPFKSANIMAVDFSTGGTPTGLTLNKLIGMREQMSAALVDLDVEKPIIVITAKQVSDLLKIAQVQSRDFNPLPMAQALQSGTIVEFMGFRFIQSEIANSRAYPGASALSLASAGVRRLPVLVPSGMHMGMWGSIGSYIDRMPERNQSTQVFVDIVVAATRLNEDKCFQILAQEV